MAAERTPGSGGNGGMELGRFLRARRTQTSPDQVLKSPDFAKLWERYDVTGRKPAHKTFQHPHVGTITLTGQSMDLEGTPGQRLSVYIAEPGTPDHDAVLLLDLTAPLPPARPAATNPEQTHEQP